MLLASPSAYIRISTSLRVILVVRVIACIVEAQVVGTFCSTRCCCNCRHDISKLSLTTFEFVLCTVAPRSRKERERESECVVWTAAEQERSGVEEHDRVKEGEKLTCIRDRVE